MATGGVVHVVDEVLTPVKHTIADILAHDKQFETFNTCKSSIDTSAYFYSLLSWLITVVLELIQTAILSFLSIASKDLW